MDKDVSSTEPTTSCSDNPWVIAIKSELEHLMSVHIKALKPETASTIFRVRGQVRKVKADHFDPELMFLGLFHEKRYDNLNINRNRGDKFRLEMTSAFLKLLKPKYDWDKLCSEIVDDPAKVQLHYGMYDRDHGLVQCVLALDAIFLVSYLIGYLFLQDLDDETKFPFSLEPFREIVSEEGLTFHNIVANDITKLENQIPLSLIKKTLEILYKSKPTHCRSAEDALNEICYKYIKTISLTLPGFCDEPSSLGFSRSKVVNFRNADHLLGCVCSVMVGAGAPKEAAFEVATPTSERCWMTGMLARHLPGFSTGINELSRVLGKASSWRKKVKHVSDEHTLQKISLPSVTKLYEAGINFRGETRGNSNIDLVPRFKRKLIKATIYIPIFSILHRTELLWRNMVAYESETVRLGDHGVSQFIYFLKFMDELIDTEHDVALLRRGRHPVIPRNLLGTEKDVAELFNKIAQHYTVVDARAPRWLELRSEIDSFYKQRYRRMLLEFLRYNFGKPWFVISLLAATILLVLTFMQTVYGILSYYGSL